jgi:hypothetical protein
MKRPSCAAAALVAVTTLSGCEYARVIAFAPEEGSGDTRRFDVAAGLVAGGEVLASRPASMQVASLADAFGPPFEAALTERCGYDANVRGLTTAVVGFVVDQFVGFVASELSSLAEELAERSRGEWRGRFVLDDGAAFGRAPQCLVLVRVAEPEGGGDAGAWEPAAAMVLAVTPRTASGSPIAVEIDPVFLELKRAVAVTARGEGVDVAVAISGRAAVSRPAGPEISEFSLGAFTVPAAPVGQPVARFRVGTGLMALEPAGAGPVEINVVVKETGSAIPDAERAKAEIAALKDAVGPEIKARATAPFEEE